MRLTRPSTKKPVRPTVPLGPLMCVSLNIIPRLKPVNDILVFALTEAVVAINWEAVVFALTEAVATINSEVVETMNWSWSTLDFDEEAVEVDKANGLDVTDDANIANPILPTRSTRPMMSSMM